MATSTLLTIDDFERLPAEMAENHELVDGELVDVSGNNPEHNWLRDYLGHGMRVVEEEITVSCHRRCARDTCLLQVRQTLCQCQASKALRQSLGQRRLGRMAAGGWSSVFTA